MAVTSLAEPHPVTAHSRAVDLCDVLYRASVQSVGSEARAANIVKAKELTARIAELLGCPDVAKQIRKAA